MPFMPKDWVSLAVWGRYETRVVRRAWKEINVVTFLCALIGTGTGYGLQYLKGLKGAQDTILVGSLMVSGATVGFLSHFFLLLFSTPAKLAAEDQAQIRQLEAEIVVLKKKVEDERNLIRRRGSAPFLKPTDEEWVRLFIRDGPGKISMLNHCHPGVLCGSNLEVSGLEDGYRVYFPVENHGQTAPAVSLSLDGVPIALEKEPDYSGAHGFYYFVYHYEKARHGKEQVLALSFETSDGRHDTHRYLLIHGRRVLRRIDPPLP
jgi:hypothetical protein